MAVLYERGSNLSNSVKDREFCDNLSNYYLPKMYYISLTDFVFIVNCYNAGLIFMRDLTV
jgi:hypothetical protein